MTKPITQQLLPAECAASAEEPSLWHWLIDAEPKRFLLPLTGVWILGLDWLIFTKNMVATLGFATPLAVAAGFVGGAVGTFYIQRRFAGERGLKAVLKSLLAGVVVGVPFPIAGTAVGGWILLASGLDSLKHRMLRR